MKKIVRCIQQTSIPFSVVAILGVFASTATSQSLQPESRRELQRIFGGSGQETPGTGQAGAPQGLQPDSRLELFRTFGQTRTFSEQLRLGEDIRSKATPDTTQLMQQLPLLGGTDPKNYIYAWHQFVLDVTAVDHSPKLDQTPASATFHQQFGPARTSRALALVHLAMFEAANRANASPYGSLIYTSPSPTSEGNATAAAVTEAAFQVLHWLYPGLTGSDIKTTPDQQRECLPGNNITLRDYYNCSLNAMGDSPERAKGMELGREVAGLIVKQFANDGSEKVEPTWNQDFVPRTIFSGAQGFSVTQWQVDPVSKLQIALGGKWSEVRPMAMTSAFQFRRPEHRSPLRLYGIDPTKWPSYSALLNYAGEYRLNSEGLSDPASSSRDGFFIAQFWAYDATAGLCAPGRLYNQIADKVLTMLQAQPDLARPGLIELNSAVDIARYYALINIALADTAIAAWDSKYYYQFPRPVTVLRQVNATPGKLWYPVGAQVSNSASGLNITPPFPAYPSGHAAFGGALFGILRAYVNPAQPFTFKYQSDEFNGQNKDVYNYTRCGIPDHNPDNSPDGQYKKFCSERTFTFDCAERENADSRIFMGVHWIFDADDGIEMGNKVARQVYTTALRPRAQPATPSKITFSAHPGQKRIALVCQDIQWPQDWQVTFGNPDFVTPDVTEF